MTLWRADLQASRLRFTDCEQQVAPTPSSTLYLLFYCTPSRDGTRAKNRKPCLASTVRIRERRGWSPDGQHLAFVRADFDSTSALVVADADFPFVNNPR